MSGRDIASLKSMLSSVFTKAAEAKGKAAGRAPAGVARAAGGAAPPDPAVRLSVTLEDRATPPPGSPPAGGPAAALGDDGDGARAAGATGKDVHAQGFDVRI